MLCLLLGGRRRKEKREREELGAFFPRVEAGHALLAVGGRILQLLGAIKC
jgi:hypothetical protein